MNKKLFAAAGVAFSLLVGSMFASCLNADDDDSESLAQAYFTVDGNATQVILHQDGGGTVIPDMSSLLSPSQFCKNERYYLQFKYRKGDVSADYMTVTGAKILGGVAVAVRNPLTAAAAAESHVSDADSIFPVKSIVSAWAYRGYLTVVGNAFYSTKDGKEIIPTYNLMYNPDEDVQPNRLRCTLLYNRHTPKDASLSSASPISNLPTSFRINSLSSVVPGIDSIEVTLNVQGVEKPTIFKMSRKDLQKGNY